MSRDNEDYMRLWREYCNGEITSEQLQEACRQLKEMKNGENRDMATKVARQEGTDSEIQGGARERYRVYQRNAEGKKFPDKWKRDIKTPYRD